MCALTAAESRANICPVKCMGLDGENRTLLQRNSRAADKSAQTRSQISPVIHYLESMKVHLA